MSERIRVLLVEDQDLLRQSLVMILGTDPGVEVVGEASDGAGAVQLAKKMRPDVILMDIHMPGSVDGIQATRLITANPTLTHTRLCMLTMFDQDDLIFEALRAGAVGYLLKDTPPAGVLEAIRALHAGRSLLSGEVLATIAQHSKPAAQPRRAPLDLTPRQTEILRLIARGLSNEEIEAELHISRSTCKTHISALLQRTGSRDRAQLAILAYETGLVRPPNG